MAMPRLNGYDATRAIRALAPSPRGLVPIVGVTALAMQGDRERCLAAGMDAYIAKPIQRSELLETIRRTLPRRPAEDRIAHAA